jgi:hypothetical protein
MLEWCWFCLSGFCNFHFNCCSAIESPHSYIPRIHVIIVTNSSLVKTLVGPILSFLVFQFKWSKRELSGMFQDLLAFLNECVPFSIASMVASNVWSIHFPLYFVSGTLLFTWHGWCKLWGHIFLVQGYLVYHNIASLMRYIEHHDGLASLGPSLQ